MGIVIRSTIVDCLEKHTCYGTTPQVRKLGWIDLQIGGVCGVMVIVVGNRHGDTSSNPGRD